MIDELPIQTLCSETFQNLLILQRHGSWRRGALCLAEAEYDAPNPLIWCCRTPTRKWLYRIHTLESGFPQFRYRLRTRHTCAWLKPDTWNTRNVPTFRTLP